MAKIVDQFTRKHVSRQRKWQLRKKQQGCCISCGEPADTSCFCLKCGVNKRERQRAKNGAKRENSCLTRRLEKGLK